MAAIVTVTLNPAVDVSTSVAALIPEKKLHCRLPVYEPGGGGINVARAIQKMGGEATAVFLSGGANGQLLQQLLQQEDVQVVPYVISNNTRQNLIVVDSHTQLQYRFGMPGPEVSAMEWEGCMQQLSQINSIDYLVASGSLSPGIPPVVFARLAAIARAKNARYVVDTSGEGLLLAAKAGAYLVKPNLGELASLVGKQALNAGEIAATARQVIHQYPCEVLVVSMGAAGALLVTEKDSVHMVPPPVRVKSTVGAGDSMLGGILLGLTQAKTLAEAVRWGVACGTAATMNEGTALCKREDAEKIYEMIHS
ncbi:6-phosphofructokinase 2 [Filimonas lacunae]|uniref:6-phosphofructokinase 2 n=1 Tax=Filimonas lacunae TaxID=477680 RepID=A0A173MH90_9BACT|nr:1-phosphofructokinase family hexose kinase [Filimonas lacunae]BAV06866.1 1-phosphofructokinase [Filimonas lacunae]SIS98651.1 6-phosphofructokinase 2 [Filimonas lacunae]